MPKSAARRRRPAAISTALVGVSVAVLLVNPVSTLPAGAAVAPGSTLRASVASDGAQAPQGGFHDTISADGTAVGFVSSSKLDNLETGNDYNIYVRDLTRNRTVLISRGQFRRLPPQPAGPRLRAEPLLDLGAPLPARAQPSVEFGEQPANGPNFDPSLSADGRYVAFVSWADNITLDGDDSSNIIVCDRDPDGDGDFDENRPDGSRDYRYFRADESVQYASVSRPRLSENTGRIVWYQTVYQGTSNDIRMAALPLNTIGQRVKGTVEPVPADLGPTLRTRAQFDPDISGDGNHVVMHAEISPTCESCEVPDFHAILSYDVRNKSTTRVDLDNGEPVSTDFSIFVMHPAISFDGAVIAFMAEEFEDPSGYGYWASKFQQPNVYAVRVDYAREPDSRVIETTLVSKNNADEPVNGASPALSGDGRYVAFVTDAVDTHDGEDQPATGFSCIRPSDVAEATHRGPLDFSAAIPPERPNVRTTCQVVVRDLIVDQSRLRAEQPRLPGTLASPGRQRDCIQTLPPDGSCAGAGESFGPALSGDGARITFDSVAADLVENDSNQNADVFVRTLQPSARAEAVDFGPVQIGEAVTRSAAVEHVGAGPLTIEEVTLAGPNAADFTLGAQTCQAQPLHQAGRCFISVTFSPSAAGERRATLRVQLQGGRALTIGLIGTGTEQPVPPRGAEFSAGPDPLDFGPRRLLSAGPAATVTVTNQGGSPLRITSVTLVPPVGPADYAVTVNTCTGVDVPPGGQCQVTVVFSPTLPGDRSAVLQFDDNAAGGPHLVGLRGQANQPAIEVNPGVTPPGRVTTVSGKDFPPGKTVTVTFRTAVGSSTATVGSDGTFRASLLVFHKATPENRRIAATVDGIPALFAEDDLLVVFPTVSPADFVVRG